jgi:hypothetical protein
MGAATELMSIFINEVSHDGDAASMNVQMWAVGRVCCTLGDERMYEIWGHWPPPESGFARTVWNPSRPREPTS